MKKFTALCMLFACTNWSAAQVDKQIGDWTVRRANVEGISAASTTNGSGSYLGFMCIDNGETCGPFLLVSVSCEEKGTYPIMINSPVGAFQATTTCATIDNQKYHLINEADIFNQALESGGEVGIAFALKDGKFQVARFSTAGAIPAIKEAMIFPTGKKNAKLRKDETL